jgi:hypothetical protein
MNELIIVNDPYDPNDSNEPNDSNDPNDLCSVYLIR